MVDTELWGVNLQPVKKTRKIRGSTVPAGAYLVRNGWLFVPEIVPSPTRGHPRRTELTEPIPSCGFMVQNMADYFEQFGLGTEIAEDDELSWAVICAFQNQSNPVWVFRFPEAV